MKITNIKREHCAMFQAEISKAMNVIAAKYGLEVAPLRMSFLPGTAGIISTKVELKTVGAKVEEREMASMRLKRYKLKIGQTFKDGKFTFEIVGFNVKSYKSPIQLHRNDGKTFCASSEYCQRFLGIPVEPKFRF